MDRSRSLLLFLLLRMLDGKSETGFLHHRNLLFFFKLRHPYRIGHSSRWRNRSARTYVDSRRGSGLLGRNLRSSRCSDIRTLRLRSGRCYLRLLCSGRLREDGFYGLFRATPTTAVIPLNGKLSNLYQGQFHQQTFIFAGAIVHITIVAKFHGPVQERQCALLCLLLITLADTGTYLKQLECSSIFAHQQITEV